MRQVKAKKEQQTQGTESVPAEPTEPSHVDNIISDFDSTGLEDNLESSRKKAREK